MKGGIIRRGKVKRLILMIVLIGWISSAWGAEEDDPGKTPTCRLWKYMTVIDQSKSGGSLKKRECMVIL